MLSLLSLTWLVPTSRADQAEVGEPAPDFSLPALDGSVVRLADQKGKIVVLEWFNPGCPYVKHAHGEGPLARLAAETVGDGVVWLAINSGAPGKQGHGLEVNQQAAATWSMAHPVLLDETGAVGRSYGATTTPQLFVIDAQGLLRYAGALDNAPLGQVTGGVVPYLKNAVDAVRAGREVATPRTKPYGCSVKYP